MAPVTLPVPLGGSWAIEFSWQPCPVLCVSSVSVEWVEGFRLTANLVYGSGSPKNEIDGALDEAVPEVMAASVVKKRVLCSIESATVEGCLIAGNPQSDGLGTYFPRRRRRCRVLPFIKSRSQTRATTS